MSTISYGSITLVDYTDLGEFSVNPMSNLPITVISDPNTGTYTPNWASNNLTITPVTYYAGQSVTPTSVTWTVQINTGTASAISSSNGENMSGNNLVVSKNRFSDSATSLVTYYVEATYLEEESGVTLTAKGQITYSIVRQANEVKTCDISGENIFKYNTEGKIQGFTNETDAYIELTGTVSNVSISKWQYKNSSGTWTDYPVTSGKNTSNSSATLNVYATESVFVDDMATIKLLTEDSSVFDIYTVAKLRDGAAGADTITSVLSNENQMVPCDSDGNPTSYDGATTTVYIYDSGADDTSNWTIANPTTTANAQVGCTGTWDSSTHTYTVTGMTADAATVTFTCSKTGYANIIKTFNLIKMKVGADGTSPTIYTIEPSSLALNRATNNNNVYTPSTLAFKAYSQTGSGARSSYSGVFKIYENGSSTASYTSSSNESSYTYTPSGSTLESIKCELYVAGGGGSAVDTQTVVVTSDGKTGEQGNAGGDAYTVLLSNEAHTFAGTTSSAKASNLTINVYGYKGTTQVATTVGTISGKPTGMTLTTSNNTTTSTTITVAVTTSMTTTSGVVTIPVTVDGKTFNKTFSYSLSLTGATGASAVVHDIYAPSGNIIQNKENNVTLTSRVVVDATELSSGVTYAWYKYSSSSTATDKYDSLNLTTKSITITPDMVDGFASFKCTATYNSKSYTAYYSVQDKSDPLQISLISTIGDKLLNGNGVGCIYATVYRNGSEIDEMPEIASSTSDSSTALERYVINSTAKTVDYYKRSSSSSTWGNSTTPTLTCTYTWSFRDKDGNETSLNGNKTLSGKVIYIDGSLITKKIIIDCQVSID